MGEVVEEDTAVTWLVQCRMESDRGRWVNLGGTGHDDEDAARRHFGQFYASRAGHYRLVKTTTHTTTEVVG
jgi:hypothetical protein